jgi:hypothetical protein
MTAKRRVIEIAISHVLGIMEIMGLGVLMAQIHVPPRSGADH